MHIVLTAEARHYPIGCLLCCLETYIEWCSSCCSCLVPDEGLGLNVGLLFNMKFLDERKRNVFVCGPDLPRVKSSCCSLNSNTIVNSMSQLENLCGVSFMLEYNCYANRH